MFYMISKGKYKNEKLANYKYVVTKEYEMQLEYRDIEIENFYFKLSKKGILKIKGGYRWDGATGRFVLDTNTFMLGSLVHDCLYQMLRDYDIEDRKTFRYIADNTLIEICNQEGMNKIKQKLVYIGVRLFGWIFCKN